jgi:formylglycine-generating enzyme required for sulfatase activity
MRHLLLAVLLVAVVGCGPDTKPEDQPASPEETVSSPETPNGSDEPSAEADVSIENSIGMRFVPIPAGTFTMGDANGDNNETPHQVTLTKGFDLGVYEVTQEQYEKVMGKNPSKFKGKQKNPVEMVSWNDAVEFCRKLSDLPGEKSTGYVYRLPTEAEWEYACRAGTKTKYSFGDSESELGVYAWYVKNSGRTTHPVGGKKPNAWGLYDMRGNVWEWCQDVYDSKAYESRSGITQNPLSTSGSEYRVLRGGSWSYFSCWYARSAFRFRLTPDGRYDNFGFRVVLSVGARTRNP